MRVKAFTLAELLMAVLVISVIMVALAPVITRRAYDNVSIEVNRKKGEEVWTNPGTYTFDVPSSIEIIEISASAGGGGGAGAIAKEYTKTFSSTSVSKFTVPKGVSRVTLTLVGGGGGGGAANGKNTGKVCKSYDWNKWNSGLSITAIPEETIVRAADNGADLCMFTRSIDGRYPNWGSVQNFTLNDGRPCSYAKCCWQTSRAPEIGNAACTYEAAVSMCDYYPNPNSLSMNTSNPERYTYRLPSANELRLIHNNIASVYKRINICGNNSTYYCPGQSPTYPSGRECNSVSGAIGAYNNALAMDVTWGNNYSCYSAYTFTCSSSVGTNVDKTIAAQTKCVHELIHITPYNGSGGSSGSILEDIIIDVLPSDVLEITAGTGGAGAKSYGSNGSAGADTVVVHKRNGAQIGKYMVSGGKGGNGASSSSHASESSDSGTKNITGSQVASSGSFVKPDKGKAPSASEGGSGGTVKGIGSAAQGGKFFNDTSRPFNSRNTTAERNAANGSDASLHGFGGGGGFTPSWATSTSHYGYGGAGKSGYVTVKYTQIATGGGGGAAGAAGMNFDGTRKPVRIKVEPGERITFSIGAAGTGGQIGSNGKDGDDTVFTTEKSGQILRFGGGHGAQAGNHNSTGAVAGSGGAGGIYINPSNNSSSVATPESAGKSGALDVNGFFGGQGALTRLGGEYACGGMQQDAQCNLGDSKKVDGNIGREYQSLLDKFGGAGGGGGGTDGIKEGSGASGSNGYVRIKWDETWRDE